MKRDILNPDSYENLEELVQIAELHGTLGLLLPEIEKFPEIYHTEIKIDSMRTVWNYYRFQYFSRYFCEELEKEGIPVAVVKGISISRFYPTPELRSFSDLDLLVLGQEYFEDACRVMERLGCKVSDQQDSHHHVEYHYQNSSMKAEMLIELHKTPVRAFAEQKRNQVMAEIYSTPEGRIQREDILGMEMPILTEPYEAVYLLLHMLQHFLNAGFGIRLLLDWKYFWEGCSIEEDKLSKYHELIRQLEIDTFSDAMTELCSEYFSLNERIKDQVCVGNPLDSEFLESLMQDIIDSGKFGETSKNRVVAMKSPSLGGMIREFHHQTRENYPNASKVFITWPVLWLLTLIRFLRNNRSVRGNRTSDVLKEAKRRANFVKNLKI